MDVTGVIDVDECAGPDRGGCSHECVNIQGSYECLCPRGYRVADDQHTCHGQSVVSTAEHPVIVIVNLVIFRRLPRILCSRGILSYKNGFISYRF